jgi:beta-glucanase (GH16 family)
MNRIIIFGLSYLLISYITFAQTPANDPHWQLKWEDNFNTFDGNRWGKGHYGVHGEGKVLYLEDQVWISNSNLVIATNNNSIQAPNPLPPYNWVLDSCVPGKTYNYRSGWVQTKYPNNFRYGYIEAKIKMNYRKGVGHAFWTYRDLNHASNAAEIDIFETIVPHFQQAPNHLSTSVHTCYPSDDPNCKQPSHGIDHIFSNFNYTDWHTYAIEWDAKRIVWYIDGKAFRSFRNYNLDNFGNSIIDPIRLIFNSGVDTKTIGSGSFTEYMYIDYVKVYQLKCDKATPLTINTFADITNYDNKVKKSITINPITIPANSNITLRANDFIQLNPGFFVDADRQLYLDVSPCEFDITSLPIGGPVHDDD